MIQEDLAASSIHLQPHHVTDPKAALKLLAQLPLAYKPDAATGKYFSLASVPRWSNLCPVYIIMGADNAAKWRKNREITVQSDCQ